MTQSFERDTLSGHNLCENEQEQSSQQIIFSFGFHTNIAAIQTLPAIEQQLKTLFTPDTENYYFLEQPNTPRSVAEKVFEVFTSYQSYAVGMVAWIMKNRVGSFPSSDLARLRLVELRENPRLSWTLRTLEMLDRIITNQQVQVNLLVESIPDEEAEMNLPKQNELDRVDTALLQAVSQGSSTDAFCNYKKSVQLVGEMAKKRDQQIITQLNTVVGDTSRIFVRMGAAHTPLFHHFSRRPHWRGTSIVSRTFDSMPLKWDYHTQNVRASYIADRSISDESLWKGLLSQVVAGTMNSLPIFEKLSDYQVRFLMRRAVEKIPADKIETFISSLRPNTLHEKVSKLLLADAKDH